MVLTRCQIAQAYWCLNAILCVNAIVIDISYEQVHVLQTTATPLLPIMCRFCTLCHMKRVRLVTRSSTIFRGKLFTSNRTHSNYWKSFLVTSSVEQRLNHPLLHWWRQITQIMRVSNDCAAFSKASAREGSPTEQ